MVFVLNIAQDRLFRRKNPPQLRPNSIFHMRASDGDSLHAMTRVLENRVGDWIYVRVFFKGKENDDAFR